MMKSSGSRGRLALSPKTKGWSMLKGRLGQFDYPGIARLKPGVTVDQASADVARMIPIALHSFPPQPGLTVKEFEEVRLAPKLQSRKHLLVGDIAKTLWVLMGTIGIV